jgi:succinate dehydrogenase cytochrome b556 subunit
MKNKIRPLSPHLNIYKPQLTSILSIFHRISGSLLTLTLVLFLCCFYIDMLYNNFFVSYAIFFDLTNTFALIVNFFLLFFSIIGFLPYFKWTTSSIMGFLYWIRNKKSIHDRNDSYLYSKLAINNCNFSIKKTSYVTNNCKTYRKWV